MESKYTVELVEVWEEEGFGSKQKRRGVISSSSADSPFGRFCVPPKVKAAGPTRTLPKEAVSSNWKFVGKVEGVVDVDGEETTNEEMKAINNNDERIIMKKDCIILFC